MSRILVPWSGGLDSTTCLIKLLRESNLVVEAPYIELENNDRKSWVEENAVKSMKREMEKTIRPFKRWSGSKTRLDSGPVCDGGDHGLTQPQVWLTHLAFLAASRGYTGADYVAVSYVKGDCVNNGATLKWIKNMWLSLMALHHMKSPPSLIFPVINNTKQELRAYLTENGHQSIYDLVWTCEDPKPHHELGFSGYKQCGECTPCKRQLELVDEP